jgi:hypothetical protein
MNSSDESKISGCSVLLRGTSLRMRSCQIRGQRQLAYLMRSDLNIGLNAIDTAADRMLR